jgi:hypothetical protein
MNAKYNAFVANGLSVENPNTAILPWISAAQASIASQLAAVNATNFAVNPSVTVSNDVAYVSGTAPVGGDRVDQWGSLADHVDTLTNWTITVPLHSGTNQFNVTAVELNGGPIAGYTGSTSVVYMGQFPRQWGRW